ncbi:hypothetical protein P7H00_00085 [Enterococcus pseudoavium]|uniref:Uncharacterized protein n=1 Tax=Enterococcus pseudoavium TaxID=44007 RepID=A0AAE4L2A9_9ENTE|nr:hypothetical protein [Enterococcus pseudoavium]MDT2735529.1 hypothetical protein [Enterococcus pseudoavium]MDT2754494.1 hypothetical protein [Enterococcus pseudoavium]MDT2769450.1 hypothetical protein [Enterococcus pseudoavium]
MIFILLILISAMFIGVIRHQKAQAQARYWERINEFEAQRKRQILATAIKLEQRQTPDSHIEQKWQRAS